MKTLRHTFRRSSCLILQQYWSFPVYWYKSYYSSTKVTLVIFYPGLEVAILCDIWLHIYFPLYRRPLWIYFRYTVIFINVYVVWLQYTVFVEKDIRVKCNCSIYATKSQWTDISNMLQCSYLKNTKKGQYDPIIFLASKHDHKQCL